MLIPVKFDPVFKERIWGSSRLRSIFNKNTPENELIGESWELADLKEGQSTVANGPDKGLSTREFLENNGPAYGLTDEQCKFPFGMLIKFLDADQDLSVQVHPDEEACKIFPDANLKTECWYVLHAEPNSFIYRGLKPGVTRDKLSYALKDGNVEELLEKYPAKKGDFHFLPAGVIHAVGAGLMVAEIQTPSDTTYRVFDWNRVDAEGKSRELHIDKALACIHFTGPHAKPNDSYMFNIAEEVPSKVNLGNDDAIVKISSQMGRVTPLLNCPYFKVTHVACDAGDIELSLDRPVVLIALSGNGAIINNEHADEACDYKTGDTILLPKMSNGKITLNDASEFLVSTFN